MDDRVLVQLVEKLTDRKAPDLDVNALRKLKLICKKAGSAAVTSVYELLMERLKDQNARTRLHALNLANELFTRSSVFRALLASSFTTFLEYSVGHKQSRQLPGPYQDAEHLRERALEYVEVWEERHGSTYPQIRMGHRYLKDVLKMKFPALRARAVAREAEAAAREERTRRINEEKYDTIREEYVSTVADVDLALEEMEASFRLLEGKPDPLPDVKADDEWEDVGPDTVDDDAEDGSERPSTSNTAGQEVPYVLSNPDPAILDSLRDSYKILTNRHLPTILEWLRVVVKVDVGEPGSTRHRLRERILRAAIAARDRIGKAKTHCETLMEALKGQSASGLCTEERPLVINASSENGGQSTVQAADGADWSRTASAQAAALKRKTGSMANTSGKASGQDISRAAMLAEVFGSDSENEEEAAAGPAAPRQNPVSSAEGNTRRVLHSPQATRRSGQALSQPQYFDPTYRQPPTAAAAAVMAGLEAASTPAPMGAERIKRSNLPKDVKKKLLAEAPNIPAGTHLAYWDSDKASLLNNKGMEVYNHWGAVDAHVELPDNVISQFFTTRASYYDPAAVKKRRLQPAEAEQGEDEGEEPPKKKAACVTAIGVSPAVATSSLGYATLPLLPSLTSCSSPADPALTGSYQVSTDKKSATAPQAVASAADPLPLQRKVDATVQNWSAGSTGTADSGSRRLKREDSGIAVTESNRGELAEASRPAATGLVQEGHAAQAAGRGRGRGAGRNAEKGTATQRALDRAHNAAVLGDAGVTDEEVARQLAEREFQEVHGVRPEKGKKRPSVRNRLAKKLLSGGATWKAIEDVNAVESENFREMESRRW